MKTLMKIMRIISLLMTLVWIGLSSLGAPSANLQTGFSLAGEWIMLSSPINGQVASPKGTTLGFPDRDMVFEQQGDIRTGVVLREDVGHDVRPLGVWRVNGNQLSATFQLWCPDTSGPCGSIVMRGEFVREDKVRGTMTAFFDQPDDSRLTGLDTWTFSYVGN